jgi:lipoprotein-anchoring transpeptidase ErfK/SrfK
MGAIFGTRQRTGRGRKGGSWKGAGVAAGVVAVGCLGLGWARSGPPPALSTQPGALGANAPGDPPGLPGLGSPCEAPPASTKPVPVELTRAFERVGDDDPLVLLDLRRLVKEHPGTPEAAQAQEALDRAQATARDLAAKAGDNEAALRQLTRAYLATIDRSTRVAQRAALLEASAKVHYGSTPSSGMTTYTIARGDVLSRVADAHRTDYRFIQRLNKMQNDRVRIGQRLKIPQAPITVVVLKKDFELVILFNGNALAVFDVATGKDDRTPESTFRIGTKMVEPDWYSPDGKVYKYGNPENILGTRWLAFENTDQHQGFGIHGTSFPESIGTEASMGCIRMRNAEVEVLYDLVPRGAEVRIVR